MKVSQFNSAALFMALALTAAPALAGTGHGGSPLASTDEHASVDLGENATQKTVEAPIAGSVNIQPGMRNGDTVKADADANAKLMNSGKVEDKKVNDKKVEGSTEAKTIINPEAPPVAK